MDAYFCMLSDCFEWMIIVDLLEERRQVSVAVKEGVVCVCVSIVWLMFSVLICMCANCVFTCVKGSTVFSLHGPYPVKEVFAVTGKTCRHLDSVAKEDL